MDDKSAENMIRVLSIVMKKEVIPQLFEKGYLVQDCATYLHNHYKGIYSFCEKIFPNTALYLELITSPDCPIKNPTPYQLLPFEQMNVGLGKERIDIAEYYQTEGYREFITLVMSIGWHYDILPIVLISNKIRNVEDYHKYYML